MGSPETEAEQTAQRQPIEQRLVEQTASIVPNAIPVVTTTPRTEQETHYKELRSYFESVVKMTLGFLGIAVAAALVLFYKDMGQIRSDAKTEVTNTTSRIRGDAASIARDEARKAVDDTFKTTNIGTIIDDAIKNQVGLAIERQVKNEVERVMPSIQEEISTLGGIADAGMKMRIGLRTGLNQLLELQRTAQNQNIRMRAKSLFESIAADYETDAMRLLQTFGWQNAVEGLRFSKAKKLIKEREETDYRIPELVDVIRSGIHLDEVAFAFLGLRQMTGFSFHMFDIDDVNRWCNEHEKECSK